GTTDRDEAERLKGQMNDLLSDKSLWTLAAKERAKVLYDDSIVNAFYDNLTPIEQDFWGVREHIISLPTPENSYTRVLFIGTTGAGKTTLVRQLLGTDPRTERFPSTSAAKTTISDLEIVLADSPYRAVVSFLPKDWAQTYIQECVVAAVLAHLENKGQEEVARKLLEHSEQRFRLSYILGSWSMLSKVEEEDEFTDEEEDEAEDVVDQDIISSEERSKLAECLQNYLESVQLLADSSRNELEMKLKFSWEEANKEDQDAFQELLEDDLYNQEAFHDLVDSILDAVEERFEILQNGQIIYDNSGWPSFWTFETSDREKFLKTIGQFSSNYAQYFGRLLTPLVQGIRAAGPFQPAWREGDMPRLVLMDGEGLGHSPDTTSSISTRITDLYEKADAIVLVDSAAQPMQAAPGAVLRSVVSSGHSSKLMICFTHFDAVKGDNLPDQAAKKSHVLNSLDNAIIAVGKDLGHRAAHTLKSSLDKNEPYFVSNIQIQLSEKAKATRAELNRLLTAFENEKAPEEPTEAKPVYDDYILLNSIQKAVKAFHEPWRGRLGLPSRSGVSPEHWTRIKALSRRPALWGMDEYDTLKPVADLIRVLSEHIMRFLENPVRWEPSNNIDEEIKEATIDNIAREFYSQLRQLAGKRLINDPVVEWVTAFSRRGMGSTRIRAKDIATIYDSAVPILDETVDNKIDKFSLDVIKLVRDAVIAEGGKFMERSEY
ncbi:MAG: hypothetical protein ACXWPG_16645, partial [Ktedonobacteraceae bacterium]